MFLNDTKTIYSPFIVGERVETKVVRGPLTGSWIPARVVAIDDICQTLELYLLQNEKYQVKRTASRVPMSSVRHLNSRFKIGESVATKISRGKIEGIWIPARVIGDNGDGTYDLFVEEYDTWKVPKRSTYVPSWKLKSVIKTAPIASPGAPVKFDRKLIDRSFPPSKELLLDRSVMDKMKPLRSSSAPHTIKESNDQTSSVSGEPLNSEKRDKKFKMKVSNKNRRSKSSPPRKWRITRTGSRVSKFGRSLSQRSPSRTKNIFSPFLLFGSSHGKTDEKSRSSFSWSRSIFPSRKPKSMKSPIAPPNTPDARPTRKPRIITLKRSDSAPATVKSNSTLTGARQSQSIAEVSVDEPANERPSGISPSWRTKVMLDDLKDEINFSDPDDNEQSVTHHSYTCTLSNWEDLYEWPNDEDGLKVGNEKRASRINLEDLIEETESEGSGFLFSHDGNDKHKHQAIRLPNDWIESEWSDALSRLPESTRPSIISPFKRPVEDLEINLSDEPQTMGRCSFRLTQASLSSRKTLSTKNATDNSSVMVTSTCQTPASEDTHHSLHEYAESDGSNKEQFDSGRSHISPISDTFCKRQTPSKAHHKRIYSVGVSKHKIQFSEIDIDTPLSRIASWLGEDSRRRKGDGQVKYQQEVKNFSYNNTTIPICTQVPLRRPMSQPLVKEASVYSLGDVLGQKSLDASKGLAFFVGPVDGKLSYKVSICDVDKINTMSRGSTVYRDIKVSDSVQKTRDNQVNIEEEKLNLDGGDSVSDTACFGSV